MARSLRSIRDSHPVLVATSSNSSDTTRTRLLRRLEFLADLAIDLKLLAEKLKRNADSDIKRAGLQVDGFGDRTLAELIEMCAEDQPYSAMAQSWMREFKERLEAVV
ncbi:hypothetical protein [Psychromarinibacter sp. S121]|uniref:hypothetical protein n=1 Tax=Psychromarinibacter sp. S121 TaxID=3415127 RepID=UPI003C7AA560